AWAWTSLGVAVGLLLVVWGFRTALSPGGPAVPLGRLRVPVVLFALSVLWISFQASDLAPVAWQHPLWKSAGQVLGIALPGRISIAPADVGPTLLRLLVYAGI